MQAQRSIAVRLVSPDPDAARGGVRLLLGFTLLLTMAAFVVPHGRPEARLVKFPPPTVQVEWVDDAGSSDGLPAEAATPG